jgi:hypothetical protein
MSNWQITSAIIVIMGPAVVIAYDILASFLGGKTATITYVVQQWQRSFPELGYFAAALLFFLWCHLFAASFLDRPH